LGDIPDDDEDSVGAVVDGDGPDNCSMAALDAVVVVVENEAAVVVVVVTGLTAAGRLPLFKLLFDE
jgi:hypothetical protein